MVKEKPERIVTGIKKISLSNIYIKLLYWAENICNYYKHNKNWQALLREGDNHEHAGIKATNL